jgi:hypothetical protein
MFYGRRGEGEKEKERGRVRVSREGWAFERKTV